MTIMQPISGLISVGSTTTGVLKLNEINNPVGLTAGSGLTATSLTFLVSNDNITYTPLYDNNSMEVSLTSSSLARSWALGIDTFFPWLFMKVQEGTSSSAVAQATVDVNILLATRNI
jgi:hypothetical protein